MKERGSRVGKEREKRGGRRKEEEQTPIQCLRGGAKIKPGVGSVQVSLAGGRDPFICDTTYYSAVSHLPKPESHESQEP